MSDIIIPDSITPFIGWRMWKYKDKRLYSVSHNWFWDEGVIQEATCLKKQIKYVATSGKIFFGEKVAPHQSPLEGCTCGIYATKTPEANHYSGRVLGKVALWGKVIEGEKGFRAEKAYPLEFYVYFRDKGSPWERVNAKQIARKLSKQWKVPTGLTWGENRVLVYGKHYSR